MPDINPADLSRPSISLPTPVLATKSITVSSLSKPTKTSQIIPPRIELETAYSALKAVLGNEQWPIYKDATTQFFIGRLNQHEYSAIVDPILSSPSGEKDHLHNQLIAAIYGNVTREMPDAGLAPWVSANDKPSSLSKQTGGDANERRLKGEVMQLPNRDRRRIKDLALNEKHNIDPYDALASVFIDQHRSRIPKSLDAPTSATTGINRMNWDIEIRKRFAQPLAVESGEFPDTSNIESRMLPFCYEAGLVSGHSSDAAQFMSIATETYIKEMLSAVFSRTRSNGPGEFGSAGFGGGDWVQTHKYRRQLQREEEKAQRGEIQRDKMGLLPVEAKAASERGPLGVSEFRLALEMGDCGLTNFPVIGHSLLFNYHEGELEEWNDHTWMPGHRPYPPVALITAGTTAAATGVAGGGSGTAAAAAAATSTAPTTAANATATGTASAAAGPSATATAATASGAGSSGAAKSGSGELTNGVLTNGIVDDPMDVDDDEIWWEGGDDGASLSLDNVLDSVLMAG